MLAHLQADLAFFSLYFIYRQKNRGSRYSNRSEYFLFKGFSHSELATPIILRYLPTVVYLYIQLV